MQIDFTLTGADTYTFTMTPLDNPALASTKSGTLEGTGPIDWIEFELYNSDSDFHPTAIRNPQATDFYIRGVEINPDAAVPAPAAITLLAAGAAGLVLRRRCLKGSG